MLRFVIFILFFTVSLSALSDSALLSQADKLLMSTSPSKQFRAYNDYKSVYVKTMSSDDKHLALRALKGIVESAVKLHIDVSSYEKELQKYYQTKFENFELSNSYSSPQLISLENEKINTDIMVVGQETNSWYGSFHDFNSRGIDKQMKIYDNFMRENYHSMSNIFFRYVRTVIDDDGAEGKLPDTDEEFEVLSAALEDIAGYSGHAVTIDDAKTHLEHTQLQIKSELTKALLGVCRLHTPKT